MLKKSKFLKEFKEFIARGNVVDMAVGVIVGGAFTKIVNSLVQSIFTPLINYVIFLCCGGDLNTFSSLDIVLIPATYDAQGQVVKSATILEFSNFITSIINFLLIAFTLFCVVRVINRIRKETEEFKKKLIEKPEEEKKEAVNE